MNGPTLFGGKGKNSLKLKNERRLSRFMHQRDTAKCMPHFGVTVTGTVVRQHRYLRAHLLEHSPRVADVMLRSDMITQFSGEAVTA